MKEQIQKMMKDLAVANDEEHLLDENTLYKCFDDNVSNNLVYGQMRVFKYLFCVIVCHCLDNALTDKDNEILKFYTEFVLDEQYKKNSLNSLDYTFVLHFYQDYASALHNKLIDSLFINLKHQFMYRQGRVISEQERQNASMRMKEFRKSCDTVSNRHWYNNGVTNVFEYECPEGFVPGQLHASRRKSCDTVSNRHWYNNGTINVFVCECPEGFKPGHLVSKKSNIRGRNWYNNGVTNVMAFECPEGFVQGHLVKTENTTRDRKWFNNGIKNVMAYECPEGFVPGRLYKSKNSGLHT